MVSTKKYISADGVISNNVTTNVFNNIDTQGGPMSLNDINGITTGSDGLILGIGNNALGNITNGATGSIAIGNNTGLNATGQLNTLIGTFVGQSMTTGQLNTVIGASSANLMTESSNNIVLGVATANDLLTGNNNIIIGTENSGNGIEDGSNNICIGSGAGVPFAHNDAEGRIIIGTGTEGDTNHGLFLPASLAKVTGLGANNIMVSREVTDGGVVGIQIAPLTTAPTDGQVLKYTTSNGIHWANP